jgi:hypothetical protein
MTTKSKLEVEEKIKTQHFMLKWAKEEKCFSEVGL